MEVRYRYLSCEKLRKICQLVPTLQIREQVDRSQYIYFFSAVSCSFLNATVHFLWTLNYAMTEYRVILLTANLISLVCFFPQDKATQCEDFVCHEQFYVIAVRRFLTYVWRHLSRLYGTAL